MNNIRNIAIIAHVDHGKTTLVDKLFSQAGMFRDNQKVEERLMDSMDLEKERGITISSKNGSFLYKDHKINIIDTPGHADFGGQVERVLKMADGAILLVDAQEGPMPQTYFVLKKALQLKLPIIVAINKIDKEAARPEWAVNEVFDLFVKLDSPDHILDFPIVYGSAKNGFMSEDHNATEGDMSIILDMIIDKIPVAKNNSNEPLQLQISSIDYSPYLGRLGIGKITGGKIDINDNVLLVKNDESKKVVRITKIYGFETNQKVSIEHAEAGEIVAIAGIENLNIGDTVTDKNNPQPLPPIEIDPPTLNINFLPNSSPKAGTEGKFVTSRHIKNRLQKETLSDVALKVEETNDGYNVKGRGELHLSILMETMRREGFEFMVTRPKVIMKEINGKKHEPFEELTIDVSEEYSGTVIEMLGKRKGQMQSMDTLNGLSRLVYIIPTRGLLGFRNKFLTETKGMGIMNYIFHSYQPYAGEIINRHNGALVVKDDCTAVGYALFNLQNRGRLFVGHGEKVFKGEIIGERKTEKDLIVNPSKGKKLSNVRAAGSDENIVLTPPIKFTLEEAISYINDDEVLEITPKSIRMRKIKY